MISPIGGMVYANQNAPAVSAVHGDAQARADFATAMAAELSNQKKQEIEETRPPEQAHQVDPDRDGKHSGGEPDDDKKDDSDGAAEEAGDTAEGTASEAGAQDFDAPPPGVLESTAYDEDGSYTDEASASSRLNIVI